VSRSGIPSIAFQHGPEPPSARTKFSRARASLTCQSNDPTRFDLVVNLKTAKALGIKFKSRFPPANTVLSCVNSSRRCDRVKPKQPDGPGMTLGNMREHAVSELFYTDAGRRPAQSYADAGRLPSPPAPEVLRRTKDLGCAPHGRGLQCKPVNVPPASMLPTGG
jgi:hypothetical protein